MRLRAATQKRVRDRPHYEHVHRAAAVHPAEGVGRDMSTERARVVSRTGQQQQQHYAGIAYRMTLALRGSVSIVGSGGAGGA